MSPSDLHRRLATALARIGTLTRAHGQRAAQDEGLSPLQARALTSLQRHGGLRVGELAQDLMVAYGTLSEAVTTLVAKGLAAKRSDPDEHRAVRVELTRDGKRAAKRVEGWPDDLLGPVVADLPVPDQAALLTALVRLIQGLERRGLIPTSAMCVNCRFFEARGGSGSQPHHCHLLESDIGGHELQVDCPDFEPADEDQRRAAWSAFAADA